MQKGVYFIFLGITLLLISLTFVIAESNSSPKIDPYIIQKLTKNKKWVTVNIILNDMSKESQNTFVSEYKAKNFRIQGSILKRVSTANKIKATINNDSLNQLKNDSRIKVVYVKNKFLKDLAKNESIGDTTAPTSSSNGGGGDSGGGNDNSKKEELTADAYDGEYWTYKTTQLTCDYGDYNGLNVSVNENQVIILHNVLTPTPCSGITYNINKKGNKIEIKPEDTGYGGLCIQIIGCSSFKTELTLSKGKYILYIYPEQKKYEITIN